MALNAPVVPSQTTIPIHPKVKLNNHSVSNIQISTRTFLAELAMTATLKNKHDIASLQQRTDGANTLRAGLNTSVYSPASLGMSAPSNSSGATSAKKSASGKRRSGNAGRPTAP